MVDVFGHVGFALLASAPVWFLTDRRAVALAFLAVSVPAGLLPDVDLWLALVFPTVKHHGVTHTVLFVAVVAAGVGRAAGPYLLERGVIAPGDDDRAAWFCAVGVLTGGLSHLFADVLSTPDISEPIEPFWPVIQRSVGIDVLYYDAFWPNVGLLAVGVLVTAGLWAWRGRTGSDDRTAGV